MINTYTLSAIQASETIGDSLSTVNYNYNTLSEWVANIQSINDAKFVPLYEFYIKYSNRMDRTLSMIQSVSAEWRSFQTTVQTNSAKWLQPMTVWYPNLIAAPFTDNSLFVVQSWLSTAFPIRNLDNSVNYVEGQEFIVSCYTYRSEQKINQNLFLRDYTVCRTQNVTIYAYCTDTWAHRSITCKKGAFSCAYTRGCREGRTSDCFYLTPYYTNVNDTAPIGTTNRNADRTYGIGKIEASVSARYTDRFEGTVIRTISFRVENCNWTFNRYIS